MLNNPLGTYVENTNHRHGRRHCIRYSVVPVLRLLCVPTDLVFAGRKAINNPCTGLVHSEWV